MALRSVTSMLFDLNRRLDRLAALAKREHKWVDEDSWYSCPKAPGGTARDIPGFEGDCDCGADEHNAEVARTKNEIIAMLVSLHE